MGFLDSFRPDWKNSDNSVRIDAVKKLEDQKILIDIAKNDPYYRVCIEAFKKIKDSKAIFEILQNRYSDTCSEIIEFIEDQAILAYVAINDSESYVRLEATQKLKKQNIIKKIALNDPAQGVRIAAIKKIEDQEFLTNLAENDNDCFIGFSAARKLENKERKQYLLAENIKEISSYYREEIETSRNQYGDQIGLKQLLLKYLGINEEELLEGIENYEILVDIIKSSHTFDKYIEEESIKKMEKMFENQIEKNTDQKMLEDFVFFHCEHSEFDHIRYMALEKIEDKKLLLSILKKHPDPALRGVIIEMMDIKDQKLLKDTFYNTDLYTRIKTIDLINDQDFIIDIAKCDPHKDVRMTAIKKIKDQKSIADIVKKEPEWDLRSTVVRNILNDQNMLAIIAKNDPESYVREKAVNKINDQKILMDITKNAQYTDIREAAEKKLLT